jgi:hypothetical protein
MRCANAGENKSLRSLSNQARNLSSMFTTKGKANNKLLMKLKSRFQLKAQIYIITAIKFPIILTGLGFATDLPNVMGSINSLKKNLMI